MLAPTGRISPCINITKLQKLFSSKKKVFLCLCILGEKNAAKRVRDQIKQGS